MFQLFVFLPSNLQLRIYNVGKNNNYNQLLQIQKVIFRMSKKNQVKPIQLIRFDNQKKLLLTQEAINLFKNIEAEQLHIITVAGKYRTGKSYILNRVLLNQNSGFQVGPTINACTKGLWMWPSIVQIKDGEQIKKCIIVDTEGLGSLQQGENTDIKIFLMAILISSYLIYNSVGNIDEKAMENLSLVINLAQLLHKNDSQYDSQQLINSFPSFMWLLRDFSLRLENDKGQPMTSQQYLENALKYQNGVSKGVERKNTIRKKLKTFFQDRNCFTLVRPTQNEKDLQNLSSLSEKRLRPQFVVLINELKEIIAKSLKPKKMRGKSITPQGFIQLCKYFVETINAGKLPSINSHWDNLCLREAERILQCYRKKQDAEMGSIEREIETAEKKQNPDQQGQKVERKQNENYNQLKKFEQIHERMLKQSKEQISKSFLGKLQKQLCKQKVQKILRKGYQSKIEQKRQKKIKKIKNIIKDTFKEIMESFDNKNVKSFDFIFHKFQEIKSKYESDIRIYETFYENSKCAFEEFFKSFQHSCQLQQIMLSEKNQYLQTLVAERTQQLKAKVNEYTQSNRELQANYYKLQLQNSQLSHLIQQLKQESVRLRQQKERLIDKIQEMQANIQQQRLQQLEMIQCKLKNEIQQMQQQIQELQIDNIKLKETIKDSSIKQRKTLREMQIFKHKCQQYLQENIDLREKLQKVGRKLLQLQQMQRKQEIRDLGESKRSRGDKDTQITEHQEYVNVLQKLNKKINQLEIKIQMRQQENRNLSNTINTQKIANEALLRAPQNINYSILKKNYQIEQQLNSSYMSKIKDYELCFAFFQFKCFLCSCKVDKNSYKSHTQNCTCLLIPNFDVSYEYNGHGQIQFTIDVYLEEEQWTLRKSIGSIRNFLKKMDFESKIFDSDENEQDDEQNNRNEERRLFLDEKFSQCRQQIWHSLYLIEYFGIDLHYLNNKKERAKAGSMRSSKISIDLDTVFDENKDPVPNNFLMKTSKFNKKIFNFNNC